MSVSLCVLPLSALYSSPKIHTGSEVSGKSSNSPKRSVSYVKVAAKVEQSQLEGMWGIYRDDCRAACQVVDNMLQLLKVSMSVSNKRRRTPVISWKAVINMFVLVD